ncbi:MULTISPECIES: hypothetical protein [unclassified Methanopyrus]|uniref:hypothetical protein n=1 Tax=unclassified Methanopyrus TaxID=2684913 RepID=UPI0012F7A48B
MFSTHHAVTSNITTEATATENCNATLGSGTIGQAWYLYQATRALIVVVMRTPERTARRDGIGSINVRRSQATVVDAE